jgi:hypothetical protein
VPLEEKQCGVLSGHAGRAGNWEFRLFHKNKSLGVSKGET